MAGEKISPGNNDGLLYGRGIGKKVLSNTESRNRSELTNDEDLIVEENTIYEIDRECYERLKKKRKSKY